MGLCKDPALTYLNRYNYNVVRLPRAGIEPLDVIGRDRSLEKLGTISQVWTSSIAPPKPRPPSPVTAMNGTQTDKLDLGIGLKILANVLSGMGAAVGLPTLNAAYKRARGVQFAFADVHAVTVDPLAIGKYLAAGSLDMANPFAERYFGSDDTDEYIIFEVLRSKSIHVTAKSETGSDVQVDIPVLQQAVGVKVQVTAGAASQSEVRYQGGSELTFGFKVFQVLYENGKWSIRGTKPSGNVAFAGGGMDAAEDSPIVFSPGRTIGLSLKHS